MDQKALELIEIQKDILLLYQDLAVYRFFIYDCVDIPEFHQRKYRDFIGDEIPPLIRQGSLIAILVMVIDPFEDYNVRFLKNFPEILKAIESISFHSKEEHLLVETIKEGIALVSGVFASYRDRFPPSPELQSLLEEIKGLLPFISEYNKNAVGQFYGNCSTLYDLFVKGYFRERLNVIQSRT